MGICNPETLTVRVPFSMVGPILRNGGLDSSLLKGFIIYTEFFTGSLVRNISIKDL